jgi:hypothetical protein
MTTVTQIVTDVLKDIGVVGEVDTPTSRQMDDSLRALNQMIAMWRTQNLNVYCQKQEILTVTSAASYTIGPSGDLNVERPFNIDAAFWRLNDVDTPLIPLHSFQDYQDISVKNLQGTPSAFYYRPDYTQGQLFIWPIPTAGSVYLTMRIPLPVYTTIQDDLDVPPEYEGAIRWNLAKLLCPTFGMPVTQEIMINAKQFMRALKMTNTQIKTMRMPDAVLSTTMYNIQSGC